MPAAVPDPVPAPTRCSWPGDDPLYVAYHDCEWGRPETDSRALWEKLILDGFQAGLAWITILRKRDGFRAAFDDFDPEKVARYTEKDVERLLADPGIVRHRGKIEATISNARVYLDIQEEQGFDRFLWQFYDFTPLQNRFETMADVPAQTAISKEMSKALKARGFKFCGPTIVYAAMQACGLVNDHMVGCAQHAECAAEGAKVSF
ncbi:MAG: DNA-3-methyladenine glycosylase I [Pseudomonadota bacterium]